MPTTETKYVEHKLYKGTVIVRFYPESHKYFVSIKGSPFKQKTGCTTIVGIKDKSKALESWYQTITVEYLFKLIEDGVPLDHDRALEAAIQNEILKSGAADIGKEAHEWCEAFINHELGVPGFENLPEMPGRPEAVIGVNAFMDWWSQNKVEPVESEKVVYWAGDIEMKLPNGVKAKREAEFIGTLDLDAKVNGKRALIDFKTSNGLYNAIRLQTRGYQLASETEAGKKLYKERWGIRLSKYSEAEYYKKEERKKELKKMIAAKKGWNSKDYDIKPYQVFEARCLDLEKTDMDYDLEGFMSALSLFRWDTETDFYKLDNAK